MWNVVVEFRPITVVVVVSLTVDSRFRYGFDGWHNLRSMTKKEENQKNENCRVKIQLQNHKIAKCVKSKMKEKKKKKTNQRFDIRVHFAKLETFPN